MVIVLSWFGIISVMMALIPVVAISPILLYIGMLIGAQAFQETPKSHAPAIVLALTPHLAAWGKLQIDNALGAAGTNAARGRPRQARRRSGVLYHGLAVHGRRRDPRRPRARRDRRVHHRARVHEGGGFALAGAVLTFFGFMHGEAIGIGEHGLGVTPSVTFRLPPRRRVSDGLCALRQDRAPGRRRRHGEFGTVAAGAGGIAPQRGSRARQVLRRRGPAARPRAGLGGWVSRATRLMKAASSPLASSGAASAMASSSGSSQSLLGLVEVGQDMADHPLLVAGMADADPDALELARAQAGVDAAQAVVAGDAAAQLDPHLAGGEVELVVEDDDVGRAAAS